MSPRATMAAGAAAAAGALLLQRRRAIRACRDAAQKVRAPLPSDPRPEDLIRFATLAASGHNAQPWHFRIGAEAIDILPDFARRTPAVDPDDHHLFASLGCAAENLALAAASRGRHGAVAFRRASGTVSVLFGAGEVTRSELAEAIPHRQSTRTLYDGRPLAASDVHALEVAAALPGVAIILVTDRPRLDRLRELVVAGNSAQMADPAFVHELRQWLRFGARQARIAGDGLYSAASGHPVAPDWLGKRMFDLAFRADVENDRYSRQLASSAGVAIILAERDDPEGWVQAGRASQRFALAATAAGLRCAFLNQPVEVPRLRPELAALIGMSGRRPNLVMRFGRGPALAFSPRRPVEAVLDGPARAVGRSGRDRPAEASRLSA